MMNVSFVFDFHRVLLDLLASIHHLNEAQLTDVTRRSAHLELEPADVARLIGGLRRQTRCVLFLLMHSLILLHCTSRGLVPYNTQRGGKQKVIHKPLRTHL